MSNNPVLQQVPPPIMPGIRRLAGVPPERVVLVPGWNDQPLNYVPSHDPNFGKPLPCVPIMPANGLVEGFGSSSDLLRIVILFLIIALVYYLVQQ